MNKYLWYSEVPVRAHADSYEACPNEDEHHCAVLRHVLRLTFPVTQTMFDMHRCFFDMLRNTQSMRLVSAGIHNWVSDVNSAICIDADGPFARRHSIGNSNMKLCCTQRQHIIACATRGHSQMDTFRLLQEVYGDDALSRSTCRHWYLRALKGDRTGEDLQ